MTRMNPIGRLKPTLQNKRATRNDRADDQDDEHRRTIAGLEP